MKTILVVEDMSSQQLLISKLLTNSGFEVVSLNDAETAWTWLNANTNPNLILLDIIMPGQSGLDLCRIIRDREKFKEVPIVFCSSKSQEFDKFWALRQGGNAYITKPFSPKELIDVVCQHVN
jgi:twitching motility two-component system response regulator PilH